jgi:hypothetical protein
MTTFETLEVAVLLFIGVFLIATAAMWAWWVKLRIIFLQEELFIIRNRLWDRAKELNAFDDEAYQYARAHLNRSIKAARFISLATVEYVATHLADLEPQQPPSTEKKALAEAIEEAYRQSAIRIRNYLLLDTMPGRIYLLRAKFAGLIDPLHYAEEPLNARVKEHTTKWIRSRAPESLSTPL